MHSEEMSNIEHSNVQNGTYRPESDLIRCAHQTNSLKAQRPLRREGLSMLLKHYKSNRYTPGLLLFAVLAFVPALLLGKTTGNIAGTARDAQGAVIPGATVTVRNTLTGVEQKVDTDAVGFYNFPALAVGTYDLSLQKTGFRVYHE